jgi:hypothetical protein
MSGPSSQNPHSDMSAAAKKWSTLAVECGPVWWLRSVVSS